MMARGLRRPCWALAAVALLLSSCAPAPTLLVVDLRTDYSPGLEFDRVEVSLFAASSSEAGRSAEPFWVENGIDAQQGLRVAEFPIVAPGTWRIRSQLLLGAQKVGESIVLTDLVGGAQAVTARVTRDCAGLECPGDGSPENLACLGGRCVDPRCSEETPQFCPTAECSGDDECTVAAGSPSCAAGLCLGGVCTVALDDTQCAYGACRPELGCAQADEIVQISAGGSHTCALRAVGDLLCWGNNDVGQLGDGTTEARMTPGAVRSLTDVVEVRAGSGHTCARRRNGEVFCWGNNAQRQSHAGETTFRTEPVRVEGIEAIGLSAGSTQSCALLANGEVRCWGSNLHGQIGASGMSVGNAPTIVTGPDGETRLLDAVALVGSGTHHCVRRRNGQMFCWGSNAGGQLGGGTIDGDSHAMPEAVLRPIGEPEPEAGGESCLGDPPSGAERLCDAVSISAGGWHTCALRAGGELYCWGANIRGELGIGSMEDQSRPTLTGAMGVVDLDAGNRHSCALLDDGSVLCWGDNGAGRLGDGSDARATRAVEVAGLSDALEVSAGGGHTCARQRSGDVLCWGNNEHGQIGDGTIRFNRTPVEILGITDTKAVTGGIGHTCAIDGLDDLYCWGQNGLGQLGDGGMLDRAEVGTAILNGVASVDSMGNFSCALSTSGQAYCWGSSFRGQIGDGETMHRPTPTRVSGIADAISISAGWRHACAALASGEVRCWGGNEHGQVGDGSLETQALPTGVLGITDAVEVSAGEGHSCARLSTGSVLCWGENGAGQVGGGAGADAVEPRIVGGIDDAIALAAGGSHTCALRASGEVSCWGGNSVGMLGTGEGPDTVASVATPIAGLAGVVLLRSGRQHSCAQTDEGLIYCWGRQTEGQLGDGADSHQRSPARLLGDITATTLGAGWSHTCAVGQSGRLRCWGDNGRGQLGIAPPWTPRAVVGL